MMKSTSRRKITKPASPLQKQTNPSDEISNGLEKITGKTPAQVVELFGISPENVGAMAGLMSGLVPVDMGVPVPEFARQASKQLWKNYFGQDFNLRESNVDVGLFSRMIELISEDADFVSKTKIGANLFALAKPIAKVLEKEVQNLSDEEKSKYYAGRANADKVMEKLKDSDYLKMLKRAPIYTNIAVAWKKVEGFKSHAERERWMRAEKIIGDEVSSREVYQVFDLIKLPGAKPGRPKNKT